MPAIQSNGNGAIDTTIWVRIGEAARATGIPVRKVKWLIDEDKVPYKQPFGEQCWRLVHLPSLRNMIHGSRLK